MPQMPLQPIILAGGSGTRLWPLSREHYPKQLLAFTGERSLLQETLLRLDELAADPLLVCNEEHRFLVAEQVRELGKHAANIILEPVGRNTAPAVTLAALAMTAGAGAGGEPRRARLPGDLRHCADPGRDGIRLHPRRRGGRRRRRRRGCSR